jgi:Dolichyl-phosphate-mannose-protein mannosyltransferase
MPEPPLAEPRTEPPSAEPSVRAQTLAAAVIAVTVAGSAAFFFFRGLTNLYGDSIAHMEGGRRLLDSLTPGYAEIGSVWLPLYHILIAPLAQNDYLWRTGLGGTIVSSAAFALAAWCIFRLGLQMNRNLAAGWVALAGFLLCPNMLYLASTPLTEPLALMWTVLTVYALFRFQQGGRKRALVAAGLFAFFGTLTRYDEWYLLPFAALFVFLARRRTWGERTFDVLLFSLISGAGPFLWILHNAYRFGNPLEFYNGPFSARAIYAHQLATTAFPYPTDGNVLKSARYYLEDLKLVIGAWPLELAILGLVAWLTDARERARRSVALLLLVLLPFYVNAMAYAAIPLYVPTLFPYTYYNLRYGLEVLPAVAIISSFIVSPSLPRGTRKALGGAIMAVIFLQCFITALPGAAELVVAKEGELNTPCKTPAQEGVIDFLRGRYDGQRVLIAAGKWPCVIPEIGIPYRQTVTDANRQYWQDMKVDPQNWVGWIILRSDDPVDELMKEYPAAFGDFEVVWQKDFPREGMVTIYRRREPH